LKKNSDLCARMADSLSGGRDHFRPITGLPVSTYFSAYKAAWLLENCPAVKAAVAANDALLGTVDSWLVWKLTGGAAHVTDVTNASRTNLLDLTARAWHAPTVELFGLDPAMLPRVVSNAEVVGEVAAGPLAGVPIAGAFARACLFVCVGLHSFAAPLRALFAYITPKNTPQIQTNAPLPPNKNKACSATSRRRSWGSAAARARPKTPTARAASCCSTRAARRCPPRTAC
jgi:hypothetical protein